MSRATCPTCGQKLPLPPRPRIKNISELAPGCELYTEAEKQLKRDVLDGKTYNIHLNKDDFKPESETWKVLKKWEEEHPTSYLFLHTNNGLWYPFIEERKKTIVVGLNPFSREYALAVDRNDGSVYVK